MRASIIAIAVALSLIITGSVVGQDDVTVVSNDQFCNLVSDDLAACEQALATLASARMLPEAFAPLVGTPAGSEPDAGSETDGGMTGLGTQSRSDMAVTITEVDWDVEGNAFLPPAEGNRFVAIHVVYEALRNDASPGTWTAVDEDGFTHSANLFAGVEPTLAYQQLRKGDKTRGWVAFEVPDATASVEFIESPFLYSGDDLVWTVTR